MNPAGAALYLLLVVLFVALCFGGYLFFRSAGPFRQRSTVESKGRSSQVEVSAAPDDSDTTDAVSRKSASAPATFSKRLGRARSGFTQYLSKVPGLGAIDQSAYEDITDALVATDVGIETATALVSKLKEDFAATPKATGVELMESLQSTMVEALANKDRKLAPITKDSTNVWLFVGVNGVGKTTTIGKLANRLTDSGHSLMLGAGDTFRAAAAEQLSMWAERSGSQIVVGSAGGDPSSVIYDSVAAASARSCDLVLADTAGRLQNKANLMAELEKVARVANKPPGRVTEVLLVLDATTGQNGLSQAAVFAEAVNVTGVVLTKLDGSAKGGIVFAVEQQLGIPVKLVGLGEGIDDLVDFNPNEFVEALFE